MYRERNNRRKAEVLSRVAPRAAGPDQLHQFNPDGQTDLYGDQLDSYVLTGGKLEGLQEGLQERFSAEGWTGPEGITIFQFGTYVHFVDGRIAPNGSVVRTILEHVSGRKKQKIVSIFLDAAHYNMMAPQRRFAAPALSPPASPGLTASAPPSSDAGTEPGSRTPSPPKGASEPARSRTPSPAPLPPQAPATGGRAAAAAGAPRAAPQGARGPPKVPPRAAPRGREAADAADAEQPPKTQKNAGAQQ